MSSLEGPPGTLLNLAETSAKHEIESAVSETGKEPTLWIHVAKDML